MKQRNKIKILDKTVHFFDICLFIYCDILNIVGYLQDGFLILDMFDLLEPDHVVDGEDLEGEVFPTGPIPTQADTSKGACKNKKFTFNSFSSILDFQFQHRQQQTYRGTKQSIPG